MTKKHWVVEAYTAMGIMTFEPKHATKIEADQHKAELDQKHPGVNFGVFDTRLEEERRTAMRGE